MKTLKQEIQDEIPLFESTYKKNYPNQLGFQLMFYNLIGKHVHYNIFGRLRRKYK